jgi:uncharacterized protein
VSLLPQKKLITRRRFLTAGACVAAGAAVYSGEIERHWIEISRREVTIPGLHTAFDGFRAVQLSDIHMDAFTEPFFLHDVVNHVNTLNPDAVFLTGDFVTHAEILQRALKNAPSQCASILSLLKCAQRYACLGNHDVLVGIKAVTAPLAASGITVLNNSYVPVERGGGRFWITGIEDPLEGNPDPEAAIPESIRNLPTEPVVLLCHAPDYVDSLLTKPVGQSLSLMLSGHTHGGQVRFPFIGPVDLPSLGQKYVEGWFRFGKLQLYVNRGIGTVGVPFRLNCPPEITLFTFRSAESQG